MYKRMYANRIFLFSLVQQGPSSVLQVELHAPKPSCLVLLESQKLTDKVQVENKAEVATRAC